ncbi:MAG: UbiA prenyltransferase family protein [Acidobacteria bacterium]|nr:UbiA prenyltransferase family protein [Acidobacteriota bacterium]MBV9477396.1 UbiA prenyltransferase family protein [Acidobacteriota bacterium]
MTDTNVSTIAETTAKGPAFRYLSCLRPQDILVLQGPPLLGAAFAMRHLTLHHVAPHHVAPLVTLVVANVLLVAHIFLLNDWSGVHADLADPNKAAGVFIVRGVGRGEMAALTATLLVLSILLFRRLGTTPLALSLAIATLSALYSLPRFNWKGKPLLNSLTHLAGGVLHFLLGYSIGSALDRRGLAIATFFALIFVAGHLTQEIRDHHGDALNAIRTNAVIFGPRGTFAASLALFTFAHAILLLLALTGILPSVLAVLVAVYPLQLYWSYEALTDGLTYASVSRLQTRYRVLYAIIGVAMVAALAGAHARVQHSRQTSRRPPLAEHSQAPAASPFR